MANEKAAGIILYYEHAEQLNMLSREDRGDVMSAMLEYGMTGTFTVELSPVARMAFSFIKQQMDRDAEKYVKKCAKNAANGAKGGRPKAEKEESGEESEDDEEDEKPNGYFENPKKPNGFSEKPNKTERKKIKPKKANEKENENEKEKENKNTHSLSECVNAHAREDTHTPEEIPEKKAYGIYNNVLLTEEEYKDVCEKASGFLHTFSQILHDKGYRYDNHHDKLLEFYKDRTPKPVRDGPISQGFDVDDFFEKAVAKTRQRMCGAAVC